MTFLREHFAKAFSALRMSNPGGYAVVRRRMNARPREVAANAAACARPTS
jgi:hypothetical protein